MEKVLDFETIEKYKLKTFNDQKCGRYCRFSQFTSVTRVTL